MLLVWCERGADSSLPPIIPHSATLMSCVTSVTPHIALPKPNGTVIKNDRNLFLAMEQVEELTCHHGRGTFSHLNPQSPGRNLFAKIQSISSKLDVRRDLRGCKEGRRDTPELGGKEGMSQGWETVSKRLVSIPCKLVTWFLKGHSYSLSVGKQQALYGIGVNQDICP